MPELDAATRSGLASFGRAAALLVLVLACSASAVVDASAKRAPDKEDDRFEPYAFVGEVNNRFAANDRVRDTRDKDDKNRINRVAGIGFEYRLLGATTSPWQLVFSGQTIHSFRTAVSDSAHMQVGTGQQFLGAIRDGKSLEGLFSARIRKVVNWLDQAGTNVPATAVYLKGQGGFIRIDSDAEDDDLLDNHFVGVGVEHLVGRYRESFLEVGTGRTELFERTPLRDYRDHRFKLGASLNYTPGVDANDPDSGQAVGLFAEFWLDSDLGPGSDDVQLYLGLFFDVDQIFDALKE